LQAGCLQTHFPLTDSPGQLPGRHAQELDFLRRAPPLRRSDRVGQADQLIDTTVGNIGPEAGATVTLQVYSGTTLKRTYAGLTS
ncbi:hypothetical protein, partial [Pseudomonas aeruginosa]|uniref:hypothetical protein n=1 Tax=Pseudomonas aeruginosa TaxID=287 RepID=UPI000BC95B3C